MFTTFSGTPQSIPRRDRVPKEVNAPSNSHPPDPPLKPKRHQVSRACDSCRMHRVKCDNNVPCRNCLNRGEQCINKSPSERRTLPQAYREIERLKQRVEELESQLEKERASSKPGTLLPPQSSILTPPSTSEHSPAGDVILSRGRDTSVRVWEGVYANTGQTSQKTWYGPSSQYYFISRMNTYLAALFQQLYPDNYLQLKIGPKSFTAPDYNLAEAEHKSGPKETSQQLPTEEYLKPTQEEYFMDLFWQSVHTAAVILDEAEFKEHYKSLLTKPGEPRKPSALVDIVIAVSMQIGTAIVPRNLPRASPNTEDDEEDDSTIAGVLYYRRCQRLLVTEQEAPSIRTLQCQILSSIYLCSASFHNMAHSMHSVSVRTAHMLGLHHEPADDVPVATKEMQKRLWWFLYTLEGKSCMKLGRPFYIDLTTSSCTLLADDHHTASLAGSSFSPVDEHTTWLTYSQENTRLVSAAREVHTAFYNKYSEIYTGERGKTIYDDPEALERYAEFLSFIIKGLHGWTHSVPKGLITRRKGGGVAFSTDLSSLDIEPFAPLWLQRQRLLLELLYHNLAMNLHRPFILFPSTSEICPPPPPTTLAHATSSVKHAMALTHIMHQVFSESEILTGWHESFQWQWNCALTLVGYLFAHPNTSIASSVRQTVNLALFVFDVFGRTIAAAKSAAMVLRDLAAKADYLDEMTRASDIQAQPIQSMPADTEDAGEVSNDDAVMPFSEDDISAMQNTLNGSMFSIDFYNNLDMLWPPFGGFPNDRQYNFDQGMGGPYGT
ncbi:fungal-specific transcription factor domain-containing protein [Biscogniauxia sp. FL1348]|nr:fungal-specific transcription factor domain-containing protein [Biscogniauxia sp. FL1348]